MPISLNPYNWDRYTKDWVFRIFELILSLIIIVGSIISANVFLWERNIYWGQKGMLADTEALGNFGDFMAGTIGIILGFASMYLLFRTLKSQRAADYQNSRLMKSQQFSNMFFELLSLYHKQVEALQVTEESTIEAWDYTICDSQCNNTIHKGKGFFSYYMRKLHDEFQPRGSFLNNQKRAVKEFQKVYGKHSGPLSAYYRTVYRIFELIENSDLTDKERHNYLKIIRAQFTRSELFFIHYNALTYIGNASKNYITTYRLTKHLYVLDYLETKQIYSEFIDLKQERINGLNSILYHLWKDIYNIGRGKISVEEVNKSLNKISTKYKFCIGWNPQKEISVQINILNKKHNLSPELHSLKGLLPDQIRKLLRVLLKCILIHSSFELINNHNNIQIVPGFISSGENITTIKVRAYAKCGKTLRISCNDLIIN